MKLLSVGVVLVAASASYAQTLSGEAAANNGSGGIFTNMTSTVDLTLTGFDLFFTGTVGTAVGVEVWTRTGTYNGFEGSNSGWTLHDTMSGTRSGSAVLSSLNLNTGLSLTAGQTMAVYLHAVDSVNTGGIRYWGTGANPPATTTFSNADLSMTAEHAMTGLTPFGGNVFTPRTFAGNVHYTVDSVPEPATMGLLGLGCAALAARRRRKK
ncbi:MAG: PEP-CTERM sorting domain-containing protein [Armatimonadetes bacterium]|nr:PEP-CTERM sorting domain-containing protein [Armatimonadota bacterium]